MDSYHLVLLDELARQLDTEGVIPFGILRNRHELAPTNTPLGVNFLHGDLRGGAALHAIAGAFFGERHHEADDYLIAKRVGEHWQHQQCHQATTQQCANPSPSVSP